MAKAKAHKTMRTRVRKAVHKTSRRAAAVSHGAADTLRSAWEQAQHALGRAQAEAEKQVKRALKRNKIGGRHADEVLMDLTKRFEKERKKAQRGLESQLHSLAGRVQKERRAAGKRVGEAVEQALAGLNIPSRREVGDLTKKVEELSRKIDALKRRR
jgi:hypothetical protein